MSLVSKYFEPLLGLKSSKLSKTCIIELANGNKIEVGDVIKGCFMLRENCHFKN
jgi:hypothetical protein